MSNITREYPNQAVNCEQPKQFEAVRTTVGGPQYNTADRVLRNYQIDAVEKLRNTRVRGACASVLVAPTGAGKTEISAYIIKSALERGSRVYFIAHRKELIDQPSRRLDGLGINHGIIKGKHWRHRPHLPVQVCSIQTLVNRDIPPPDLIFVDECHRAPGPTYRQVLARFPRAYVIGLTATPCRTDGTGLGELFDSMVLCPSVGELIADGYLVPFRLFCPSRPDLAGVRSKGGDYIPNDLARVMDKPGLTGDVVAHWMRYGEDRVTLGFAANIAHSQHVVDRFQAAGIRAEHADGKMPEKQREDILGRFEAGITRVVFNVDVFCEGTDIPSVSCVILHRATQSLRVYLQQCGRGARLHAASGKKDCLIFDHAGNSYIRRADGHVTANHGAPEDPREWSLDGVGRGRGEAPRAALAVRMCPQCWAAYPSTLDTCPHCGKGYERKVRKVSTADGELEEISADVRAELRADGAAKPAYTIRKLSKNPKVAEIQKQAEEKGYKPGWVFHRLEELRAKGELTG